MALHTYPFTYPKTVNNHAWTEDQKEGRTSLAVHISYYGPTTEGLSPERADRGEELWSCCYGDPEGEDASGNDR